VRDQCRLPPDYTKIMLRFEIRLLPNGMEIISYPGPLMPLDPQELNQGRFPFENTAIRFWGTSFKQRRLVKSKATGLMNIRKAMQDNGSS